MGSRYLNWVEGYGWCFVKYEEEVPYLYTKKICVIPEPYQTLIEERFDSADKDEGYYGRSAASSYANSIRSEEFTPDFDHPIATETVDYRKKKGEK